MFERQPRGGDQAPTAHPPRGPHSGGQCLLDRPGIQRADGAGHETVAQIRVGVERMSGHAFDGGVLGVDRVGDQGRGDIGGRGGSRQHGHRVSDPERLAAPLPAAGRNAADAIPRPDLDQAVQRRVAVVEHHGRPIGVALADPKGDVAAIVHIGAGEPGRGLDGVEDVVGDSPGHGRHRGDEILVVGQTGVAHAAGDGACQRGTDRLAQEGEFGDQPRQGIGEDRPGPFERLRAGGIRSVTVDDQVNRAVLEMDPASVGQEPPHGARRGMPGPGHAPSTFAIGAPGQGPGLCQRSTLSRSARPISSARRTASIWPPNSR